MKKLIRKNYQGDTSILSRLCQHCRENYTIEVETPSLFEWKQQGKLAQVAFFYLNPSDVELIISGTHPECWDQMFADNDEA